MTLEWLAGDQIKEKNIYRTVGLMEGKHPFMEYDGDLGYRIRRQAMSMNTHAFLIKNTSKKIIQAKLNFTNNEGIIRNENGDVAINSLGYRGPYFEIKKARNIYRIVTLGGSTTAGLHENGLTYPRILERMLNQSKGSKKSFQVINAGMWGYNTCQVKTRFKNEIVDLNPDMILLMSGWNDINKFRSIGIKRSDQYCENHHPLLIKSNIFRWLRFTIGNRIKKTNSELGFKVLEKNIKFYESNLREIAETTQKENIKLVFVGLPGVYENNGKEDYQDYIQFISMNPDEITYRQQALLSANKIKVKLAREYSHASFVENGLSINIPAKNDFFFDTIHPTGSGNRIMAFRLLEPIMGLVNNTDENKINIFNKNWSKNSLELEYLKSIFASNRIEDLTDSGCVALNNSFCSSAHKKLRGFIYVRAINEFALGSLLQFPEEIKKPVHFRKIEGLLKESILMGPDNSVSPWVLGALYSTLNNRKLAAEYFLEAEKLNPLLKKISFEKEKLIFKENYKRNPFIDDYLEFINILRQSSHPDYKFLVFHSILRSGKKLNETKKKIAKQYIKFYLANPILGRSIFTSLINHLKLKNEHQFAQNLKAKADLLEFRNERE